MSGVSESQNSLFEARSNLVEGKQAAEDGQAAFDKIKKPADDAEDARSKALSIAQAILRKFHEVEDDLSELGTVLNSGRLACVHVKIGVGDTVRFFGTAKDHATTAAALVRDATGDGSSALRAAQSSFETQERVIRVDQSAQDFETSFLIAGDKAGTFALSEYPPVIEIMKKLVGKVAALGQEDFSLPGATADGLPFGEQATAAFNASIEQVDQYTQNL